MSSNLFWFTKPQTHDISSLKKVIAREVWDTDGSMSTSEIEVDNGIFPFLRGLIASNEDYYGEDAKSLIEAIEKHGTVYIKISW